MFSYLQILLLVYFLGFVHIKLIYSEIGCPFVLTRLVTIFSSPTLYPNWTSSARVMGLFLRLLLSLACRVYSDIPAHVVLQRFIPRDPSPAEIDARSMSPSDPYEFHNLLPVLWASTVRYRWLSLANKIISFPKSSLLHMIICSDSF